MQDTSSPSPPRSPAPSPAGPRLRVALFAGVADLAGARVLELPWGGGTVADVRTATVAARPATALLVARSTVAVDGSVARDDAAVAAGADVAILPPVSGG